MYIVFFVTCFHFPSYMLSCSLPARYVLNFHSEYLFSQVKGRHCYWLCCVQLHERLDDGNILLEIWYFFPIFVYLSFWKIFSCIGLDFLFMGEFASVFIACTTILAFFRMPKFAILFTVFAAFLCLVVFAYCWVFEFTFFSRESMTTFAV